MSEDLNAFLALARWRRTVAEGYADVRRAEEPIAGWRHWLAMRNELFKHHSQSPLTAEQKTSFNELAYYPYDPAFRVTGCLDYGIEQKDFKK